MSYSYLIQETHRNQELPRPKSPPGWFSPNGCWYPYPPSPNGSFNEYHSPATNEGLIVPDRRSRGEWECVKVLSQLLPQYTFNTYRPDWLKRKETGNNLELDLFCPDINLAIEFNGRHHYQYIPEYFNSYEAFLDLQKRDRLKKILCVARGVTLLVVRFDQNVAQTLSGLVRKWQKYYFGRRIVGPIEKVESIPSVSVAA